jgi:hypothetical protein
MYKFNGTQVSTVTVQTLLQSAILLLKPSVTTAQSEQRLRYGLGNRDWISILVREIRLLYFFAGPNTLRPTQHHTELVLLLRV